jgi:diguanylate cyclase (GGDEF)-like protein
MEIAPDIGNTAIIIPAYYVSVGITLCTGIQATVMGLMGHRTALYLTFALLSFTAAGFQLFMVDYFTATSVSEGATALRGQIMYILFFMPAFFAFVTLYTNQQRFKLWLTAIILITAGFMAANFASPYSLRFESLEMVAPLHLPWGESLSQFSGKASISSDFARLFFFGILGWTLWRAVAQYRLGERRMAGFLAACVALLILSALWGNLIDHGVIRSFYVAGFAFLGLVLFMSISLGLEVRDRATRLEATTADLRHIAYHDFLTGLANRAQFHEHLAAAIQNARCSGRYGTMILLDLDHFRTINDALSHEVGDRVLQEAARRLTKVAPAQAFVARLGGDEFALIMHNMSKNLEKSTAAAHRLAEDARKALSHPIAIGGHILNVGASIGIASFPHENATPLDTLRHADMALYRSKSLGRDGIQFYAPSLQTAADERLGMMEGLGSALDHHEFTLHFQPKVDAAGSATGAEALLRWHHPQLGDVPPSSFIPIAEESGQIHAIGTWVLDQACEQLAQWARTGAPFAGALSINVSPWQLTRPDFVDLVGDALARHGVDPRRLTIEITESVLLYDVMETIGKLGALRTLGLKVSLDDFGTGYSSLAYLRDLPLDEIKIDRAFVHGLEEKSNRGLVESMISVGQHMALHVVAEGVETPAQRDALVAMGCSNFQGYLFSRPLSEQDFVAWLVENQATIAYAGDAP